MPKYSHRVGFVAAFTLLGTLSTFSLSCTEKPKPAVAPIGKLGPIETPEDLVAVVIVRDFGATAETASELFGGPNPIEEMRKNPKGAPEAFADVDVHAAMAMVTVGDLRKSSTWHFVAAAKLQHVKDTKEKLAKKFKGEVSPSTATPIYTVPKGAFTVIGEYLVFGDLEATINAAGRFVAREAEGTPPHDIVVQVPLARWAGALRKEAAEMLKEASKDADFASFEPIGKLMVDAVGDVGDLDMWSDLDKETWTTEVKIAANGRLSEWLGAYPSAPLASLMSLPKASSAGLVRFPDSIAKAWDGVDPAATKSPWGSLMRSMGNEVAFAFTEKGAKPGDPFREFLLRVDLADAKAAKASILQLLAQELANHPDRKLSRTPWSKMGADGESLSWVENGEKQEARWAIKAPYLYVDMATVGKITLIDGALDPNNKAMFRHDPRSKTFESKLPKDGLVAAYYGETDKAPKPSELGAVATLAGVRFGSISVAKTGISAMFTVPVADLKQHMHPPAPPVSSAAPSAAPSASAPGKSASSAAPSAAPSASAKAAPSASAKKQKP